MEQISGGNFRVSYKLENTPGVPDFAEGSTIDTTLAENVTPGSTVFNVVDGTGASAGLFIRLGDDDNPEYLEILSVDSDEITLDPKTPVSFLHFKGEIVKDVPSANLGGFKRLPGFVSSDELVTIGQIIDDAIRGDRGQSGLRPGNVNVAYSMTMRLGLQVMTRLLRYHLGNDYSTVGTTNSGMSTTLASGASPGDTSVDLDDVTNGSAGDTIQLGAGDTAEVVKIDSGWDEVATTVPLDSSTPVRHTHSSGAAVEEVSSANVTHTVKRTKQLQSLTMLFHATDNDLLLLVKGNYINQINGVTIQPNEETLKFPLGIVGLSAQLLSKDIFQAPADAETVADFYAPWEAQFTKGGVVNKDIESLNFTSDNQIETGGQAGRTIGSRFRRVATPGKGIASGSFQYVLRDNTELRKMLAETNEDLKFNFVYANDTNHELGIEFKKSPLSGGLFPGIADDGPVSDTKNFTAIRDDSAGSDMIMTIKTPELTLV